MGSLFSRLSQLTLGDLDSALDPDAYRPKLETEFNTPESKSTTRIQLPDPRSISRGIDRTPLFAFVEKEEVTSIVHCQNSTPLRPEAGDQDAEEMDISVTNLPKRLLETDLDESEVEGLSHEKTELAEVVEHDEAIVRELANGFEDCAERTENSVDSGNDETLEVRSCEEVAEEFAEPKEAQEESLSLQAGMDLSSLRKHLFTTPQQQSIKSKRVPLGFVCPNTGFESLQENPLSATNSNEKNWKNVTDERYRLGLTASSDPENTPPSVLRLTEPPDGVQSAPGKFKNPCRKRFEPRNSSGLFI